MNLFLMKILLIGVMILSENYYNGKYADIEFSYNNNDKVIKHKNITFTKNDILIK